MIKVSKRLYNLYKILNINKTDDNIHINNVYNNIVRENSKNPKSSEFLRKYNAYELLMDKNTRKKHDDDINYANYLYFKLYEQYPNKLNY